MAEFSGMLIINMGSTSTKLGYLEGDGPMVVETIRYTREDLALYPSLSDQIPRREQDVSGFLEKHGIRPEKIHMVVSRGGLGRPAPSGAYEVDELMCRDLMEGNYGKHPSALGPVIALSFAQKYGSLAIVIDPPSTDEFHPLARLSGIPEIERKSALHCLNQKSAARRLAKELGTDYWQINLVVAHLGGGISIGAHKKGWIIDCTNGLAEGPFSPERAGALPTIDLIELAFSGNFDRKQLQTRLVGEGGLYAYLQTTDIRKVEAMIENGDEKARLVFEAMAYQISKDIGAMCVVLKGEVDGIVLTGGMAYSATLTRTIQEWVAFLAPVFVFPGEDEMTALAEGGQRVLLGEEQVLKYSESASIEHHEGFPPPGR